ncbi:YjfK family protein [Marinobacterium sp. D7]|uniref:YjfK family protein n=1 Tax=Marinobacterium ramblicola TaxID=2849041 RepID=UPI001C2DD6F2|nr:YjfK family protein [Marinobacterium ramblicola]MBV1787412.1 YjfK family protein [Marinobacterium ramblicola]
MFSSWFGRKKETPKPPPAPPEILGFRLGGAVELNALKLSLLDDRLITDNIAKTQLIQAVGVVELDESSTILRYYTDDEAFFQVMLTGGMREEHITDVKLFHFHSTLSIAGQRDWEGTLNKRVSLPRYDLEGKTFNRVWETVGDNPPLAITEQTTTEDNAQSRTDQFMMLYELDLDGDLYEFLLVSAEEKLIDNRFDRCLVISTGINLGMTDFEVIG